MTTKLEVEVEAQPFELAEKFILHGKDTKKADKAIDKITKKYLKDKAVKVTKSGGL